MNTSKHSFLKERASLLLAPYKETKLLNPNCGEIAVPFGTFVCVCVCVCVRVHVECY